MGLWLCLLAAGLTAAHAMPHSSFVGPLEAQRTGQMSLVVVRMVAFAGALVALRAHRRRERWGFAFASGAALVVSMVWNVGALALAAVACVSLVRSRVAFHVRALPLHLGAVVLGVVAGLAGSRPAPPPPAPTIASEAMRWIERDNPHRALPLARAWASDEPAPAEGALALAAVARRLGDEQEARRIAEAVLRGGPAATRDRARAFLEGSAAERGSHDAPAVEGAP